MGGCLLSIAKIIAITIVLLFIIGFVFGDEEEKEHKSENIQQVEQEKNQEDEKSKRIEEAKKLEEEQQRFIEEQERVKEETREQLAYVVEGIFA